MELADILALVKAGYTREEISQMDSTPAPAPAEVVVPAPAPAEVVVPAPAPAEVVVPAPVPQPEPQPVPKPVQEQEHKEPTMAELMQSIAKLTSAVQANAIAHSVIPGGANPQPPTAEDMLAEIIRPTFKERSL